MSKGSLQAIAVFSLLLFPGVIFASVSINEVFYDTPGSDKGSEWVEVYNGGPMAVDLASYRFSEGGVNHKLKSLQGTSIIPALGFAVITNDVATFKSTYSQFGGNLFESSFSLNNTGETIAIKNSKLITMDQFTYSSSLGANSDGDSLQKFPDGWKPLKPTPGAGNIFVGSTPPPKVGPPLAEKTATKKATSTANSKYSNQASAGFNGSGGDGFFKWAIVLGGVLVAGVLAFFLSPKSPKKEVDEIEIVE